MTSLHPKGVKRKMASASKLLDELRRAEAISDWRQRRRTEVVKGKGRQTVVWFESEGHKIDSENIGSESWLYLHGSLVEPTVAACEKLGLHYEVWSTGHAVSVRVAWFRGRRHWDCGEFSIDNL